MPVQHAVSAAAPSQLLAEQIADDRQQHARDRVGEGDHRLAPDRVEQRPEQQRPGEIAEREGQDVPADRRRRHLVEPGQHQRIGKEDRVVEKRLRRPSARGRARRGAGIRAPPPAPCATIELRDETASRILSFGGGRRCALDALLDLADHRFGLVEPVVQHQPARAFRNPAAQKQDRQARAPRRCRTRRASPNRAAARRASGTRPRRARPAPRRSRSCH